MINQILSKIKVLLLLVLILLLSSCNNQDNKFIKNKILGKIAVAEDSLGSPREILICNNYLIIHDRKPLFNNNQLRIYSKKDFKFINSLCPIGRGPVEFQQGLSLNSIYQNNGGFSIFDVKRFRLLFFKINTENLINFTGAVDIHPKFNPYTPIVLDSSIFSLGLAPFKERFVEYDLQGMFKSSIGYLPLIEDNNIPMPLKHAACKGIIRIAPNGTKIIISYQYADIIDVYDNNKNFINRISSTKDVKSYKYSKIDGVHTLIDNRDVGIIGYIDIYVTNTHIFGLYSGKEINTKKFEAETLHVFSLDGVLERKIHLDPSISQMSVDPENKKLFGFSYYEKPNIYAYELNFDL